MGIFIVALAVIASIGVLMLTPRCLRRSHARGALWLTFSALTIIGLGSGVALSFWERQTSPTRRIIGWPFPGAIFQLEHGEWVDYVPPFVVGISIVALNALLIAAVALLPLLIAAWLKLRREKGVELH